MNNKKYSYILKPKKKTTFFECKAAAIAQDFLNEDIPGLLADLPELIIAEQEYRKSREHVIRFRVSKEDKKQIKQKAVRAGYNTISAYLRALALGV